MLQDHELGSGLRGEVVFPRDGGYDAARGVFNGMIDRRPLAVIRAVDASDVVRSITFARRHDLPLSVRGGGHSVAGHAVGDGAVMLDLSGMKAVRVDPETRTMRAEAGLTLGEFDRATQTFGLATTLGIVSVTGIAGLTLGGGLGWLNGRHGLACDNLIAAVVATADGQLLKASAAHATSPNMAEGAAMALEDGLVLAECLTSGRDIAPALARFQARRRPRTQWVLAQTHRRDHTRNLPPALRNLLLRRWGRHIFHANYHPLLDLP